MQRYSIETRRNGSLTACETRRRVDAARLAYQKAVWEVLDSLSLRDTMAAQQAAKRYASAKPGDSESFHGYYEIRFIDSVADRTQEVIFRRMPCDPGKRIKPSDYVAIMPYEAANRYKLAGIGATFESEHDSGCGWTGFEIDFTGYHRSKRVRRADVPASLISYLEWNPDAGPAWIIKERQRIDSNRYRQAQDRFHARLR